MENKKVLSDERFGEMQTLKRRFFAMRNGVIADALRRGGSPYRIIFGLNLPQLVDIAKDYGHRPDLARALWANDSTRESRLLAPMLLGPDDVDADAAVAMAGEIADVEVADVFCHRFLRHHPQAREIAGRLCSASEDMQRYVGLRLLMNLVAAMPMPGFGNGSQIIDTELLAFIHYIARAEQARECPLTHPLTVRVIEECEFRIEE